LNDSDLGIIAEVLRAAEARVARDFASGRGSGLLTLAQLLRAYERVLPKHGVVPADDIYFYRCVAGMHIGRAAGCAR